MKLIHSTTEYFVELPHDGWKDFLDADHLYGRRGDPGEHPLSKLLSAIDGVSSVYDIDHGPYIWITVDAEHDNKRTHQKILNAVKQRMEEVDAYLTGTKTRKPQRK